MNKQQKIDLMVKEIMGGEQVSILFDPYENVTDCMILWDKFSLGQFVEISSYIDSDAFSGRWVARRLNTRYESDLECSSEGHTMIEAMCGCMFRAAQRNPEKFSAKVSGLSQA